MRTWWKKKDRGEKLKSVAAFLIVPYALLGLFSLTFEGMSVDTFVLGLVCYAVIFVGPILGGLYAKWYKGRSALGWWALCQFLPIIGLLGLAFASEKAGRTQLPEAAFTELPEIPEEDSEEEFWEDEEDKEDWRDFARIVKSK